MPANKKEDISEGVYSSSNSSSSNNVNHQIPWLHKYEFGNSFSHAWGTAGIGTLDKL